MSCICGGDHIRHDDWAIPRTTIEALLDRIDPRVLNVEQVSYCDHGLYQPCDICRG